jgi:hypothetical protein
METSSCPINTGVRHPAQSTPTIRFASSRPLQVWLRDSSSCFVCDAFEAEVSKWEKYYLYHFLPAFTLDISTIAPFYFPPFIHVAQANQA